MVLTSAFLACGVLLTPTGHAQLVSFQPFDNAMCPWPEGLEASSSGLSYASAAQSAVSRPDESQPAQLNIKPARYIKDDGPAWSAVAVNPENNMVIFTDENLHRIVEFGRLDNTPPGVQLTAPKRVIGGLNTMAEMLCGVYIDPKTLEIRVTNNDTQDWMPIFSREAQGDVKPDRFLATPHQAFGIAVDEIREEMYLTVQGGSAVVVYRKGATGYEAPLRIVQGGATQLADPHGIAVDVKHNVFVVANHGHRSGAGGGPTVFDPKEWAEAFQRPAQLHSMPTRRLFDAPGAGGGGGRGGGGGDDSGESGEENFPSITIHSLHANSNAPPVRVIKGPKTQLNWPVNVAIHEEREEIFVANDAGESILVFKLSDNGDVPPTRVLSGPRTGINNPTGIALDRVNGELWVANMGNYNATVYPLTAEGDVPPVRTIRGGPAGRTPLMIGNPGGVGYDTKREQILVPN
jgi:DNA-binding beta-propeller fold protein YncE